MPNIKAIRDRLSHALSPQTAEAAGMSLAELQQFVAGSFHPIPEQIERLARQLGVR
jgi:hypothetical protein